MSNNKTTPALAHYADKEVTPVIAAYTAWLEEQTGYKVDPLSVYIGSQLRGTFQKSEGNQKRLAAVQAATEAEAQAKAARKVEREQAAKAKAAEKAAAPKAMAAPKATTKKPAPKATPKAKPVRAAAAKPATRKATTTTEAAQA